MSSSRFVVAVTGASGAAYAQRILELLGRSGARVELLVTSWGRRLIKDELGMDRFDLDVLTGGHADQVRVHNENDVGGIPGSGSFMHDGMVIVPCSANTLGRIAAGMTDNLVHRAAACSLKERHKLILCHRETPLTLIEIENMATVTRAGGTIAPLNPGFYLGPNTVEDILDFMAGRVLDLLGVKHDLSTRWEDQLTGRDDAGSDAARK